MNNYSTKVFDIINGYILGYDWQLYPCKPVVLFLSWCPVNVELFKSGDIFINIHFMKISLYLYWMYFEAWLEILYLEDSAIVSQ